MEITGQAVLLRVFIGESDKLGHLPLYEAIVTRARNADLAGATVLKGVLGFGATARLRTQKILDLSSDLPLVVEIVDGEEKIGAFRQDLSEMFEKAACGGLMTMEKVRVVHYLPGDKKKPR
jgi:PII-like signaling protein